ncbi:cytochrome P450 [Russula dissimulans]|nr:cytochrome P450 [Russula dissimulans]
MVSLLSTLDFLVLVSSLATFLAIRDHRKRRGLPYPPGPRPLPLIGNLFDIPKQFSWLTFSEHSKKHGDIISFHVFGQTIVVLHSIEATKDLLEKRADIYSDRPAVPIYNMMKWGWFVPLVRYTEFWRQTRRLLERGLRPGAVIAYRHLQQTKARALLSRLLTEPDQWEAHFEYLLTELILGMGYGYEVQGPNDRRAIISRKMAQLASETTLPGALLVNDLPFLRYIPEWLPWLSYKPLARYGYDIGQEVLNGPMIFVKESILHGTAQPSLALESLQESEKLGAPEREKVEEVIAGALGSMYLAGVDTIMAQKQLDAVTGRERLPTFEDRPSLPIIDAICKEVLRWGATVPVAVPHASTEDDIYEGFFIPKGSLVIGNAWAILHDPVRYPEPDSFKPERFLDPDGTLHDDPVLATAYGFGKRICPGRHFVDITLFIVVASLLSVFNSRRATALIVGTMRIHFQGTA